MRPLDLSWAFNKRKKRALLQHFFFYDSVALPKSKGSLKTHRLWKIQSLNYP